MIFALTESLRRCDADGRLRFNEPMKKHTTLRLGGLADVMAFPIDAGELSVILRECADEGIPVTILGGGSNMLVRDGGIGGVVLKLSRMSDVAINGECLHAQGGATLPAIAQRAAEAQLSGLEFAAGIPGSVGGAVFMNAGAYGGEMAGIVTEVRGVGCRGEDIKLSNTQMQFGYRTSACKSLGLIVTDVTMKLIPGRKEDIDQRMNILSALRREKQPGAVGSCGSTFKRPASGYAAALIDEAGLKGFAVGKASVSEKHAGFLLNNGGSSATDYLSLISQVQEVVYQKTGIRLETEVQIIGRETVTNRVEG